MSQIDISRDIIPIGEFKLNPTKWMKSVKKTRHPLVITLNGKAAGVLLSPEEYDLITYERRFKESVKQGLDDSATGNVMTTKELKAELDKRRKERGWVE